MPSPFPVRSQAGKVGSLERRAWIAGYVMMGVSACFLGVLVVMNASPDFPAPHPGTRDLASPVGWTGLACALALFGSIGIMVKIPSVMDAAMDPMVFQIYQSAGTVSVSAVVLL